MRVCMEDNQVAHLSVTGSSKRHVDGHIQHGSKSFSESDLNIYLSTTCDLATCGASCSLPVSVAQRTSATISPLLGEEL